MTPSLANRGNNDTPLSSTPHARQAVVSSLEFDDEGPFVISIVPMGKPRMTQRDKWKKRSCVTRYRAFSDQLRAFFPQSFLSSLIEYQCVGISWTAFLPIPKSWSKKKKAEHAGQLHLSKPDRDNIDKAILDTLIKDDSGIATGSLLKLWDDGKGPRLILTFHFLKK